ncbi:nuclear transport factor 2 family protein [Sphingomonas ursincola]|jgi:limonene-1,2-epoxide hydrolase|uniref:nuclear transport factor 2 family protein n=1 Tax=Sphingomonas ursincola TaxID=56361 RepID=UPI0023562528|nr:limonene-1,2-epoxide hydrolase family protein [Sphingomonas ursincola]MBY0621086.1 nuclear transport factor 2 family protein [Sphingomonas ursincola]
MNRFRSAAMALTVAAGLMLPGAALAETAPAPAAPEQESSMTDPKIAVVEKMIDAWNRRDWKLVGDLFAEDGVLHSMMIEPVNGRPAIAERINALGAGIESITLHIHNIGRIGDVVVIERTDEFVYKGHHGKVPVVGILEVEGDHVKVWREYYDRAELLREMGIGEEFHKPAAAH